MDDVSCDYLFNPIMQQAQETPWKRHAMTGYLAALLEPGKGYQLNQVGSPLASGLIRPSLHEPLMAVFHVRILPS